MKTVRIGTTEMTANAVGLGCMGFSHAYGAPTPREEAVRTIRQAFEMGYNFFDTAECYTGINEDGSVSYNEELVGEALKDVRDQVIICTKFGVAHKGDHLETDSSPETIRKSVEGSLKRLGTDYIDVYYQHRIDPAVEPETVAQVMKELMEEGKIRAWGISETTEEYLRRAHAVCPVSCIQNRYSMMARWYESIFPVCEELGVTYVAFSPLANGALSGSVKPAETYGKDDFRARMPQYEAEQIEKTQKMLDTMGEIASAHNATSAQLSLAWMINKKDFILPIPGSRKLSRLQENYNAGNIELSGEEVKRLDDILDTMDFAVFGGSRK